jgi:hypothetical protein
MPISAVWDNPQETTIHLVFDDGIYSPIHENLLKSRDFELMKPIKNHIGLVKNAMRTDR